MSDVVVPQGWCVATIMDVAKSSGGGTPPKGDQSYWTDGTVPWVSPKDMKSFLMSSSEDSVTSKALHRLTLIPSDSILVVVRSGILSRTLPVSINKVPVTVNQDMRAFVPESGIDARYLAWQLISNERDILDRCAKDGTTVASIEGPALAGYPFSIAPLDEQTRIVEKLEELLSDLDAGVAELKAAQRKLAQYRQSLLKAAVEGVLTADWRATHARDAGTSRPSSPRKRGSKDVEFKTAKSMDSRFRGNDDTSETGADLLQRILTERRARWEQKQLARFAEQGKAPPQGWQAKYPEPVAPDLTDAVSLPERWACASIEQLAELVSGHTPKEAGQFATDDGATQWFKVGDMNAPGNEDTLIDASVKFAGQVASELGLKVVPAGTIVFPKRGGAIATNKKRRLGVPAAYDLNMMGLVAVPSAAEWLWSWFKGVDLAKLSDGSNIPQINNPDIAPLYVPIPPAAEQEEILHRLESALESVVQQEEAVARALKQAAAQRKNLLRAAFSGQLVPQDPNDEPASALLARIRAARKQSPPARGRRRAGSNRAPATSSPQQNRRGRKARKPA